MLHASHAANLRAGRRIDYAIGVSVICGIALGIAAMKHWLCALASVILVICFPSAALASDFGGLAIAGLLILAGMFAVASVLATATIVLLNRKFKGRISWWWMLPVFIAIWFYVVFKAFRFLLP